MGGIYKQIRYKKFNHVQLNKSTKLTTNNGERK